MPSSRPPKQQPIAFDPMPEAESTLPVSEAANDLVSTIEIENLDSSVGSYDRLAKIRKRLRQSDVWVAIAVYVMLGSIAFVII